MSHNRLDYISNFKEGTVEKMTELRQKYQELEKALEDIMTESDYSEDVDADFYNIERVMGQALNHLEKSQMYAIKLLCLLGEDCEKTKEQ